MIHRLRQRCGRGTTRPIWSGNVPRQHDGEVTLQEYADRVGAHRQTVSGWLRRGQIKGRLVKVGSQRISLVNADDTSTGTCTGEPSGTHHPDAVRALHAHPSAPLASPPRAERSTRRLPPPTHPPPPPPNV